MTDPRRSLAQAAYEAHVSWGQEQHPGHRRPWGDLSDSEREPYERIVSAVARHAIEAARVEVDRARATVMAAVAERDRKAAALERCADRAVPGVERDTWLAAAAIVKGEGHVKAAADPAEFDGPAL